jgi:hypothetical protein
MRWKWGVVPLIVVALTGPHSVHASTPTKARTIKAGVKFLATSSSVRSGWAGNMDIYLAELRLGASPTENTLAWLIDEYPSGRSGISTDILTAADITVLRLHRDRGCDTAFGSMPLRTAPGNPMAILPEPLSFHPVLPDPTPPQSILPCYRIVRRQ